MALPLADLRRLHAILLMICVPVASFAQAAPSDIEWHGFLNVVGGILSHEPVTTSPDSRHPGRLGYSDKPTLDEETSAGLQATRWLDDGDSVTAQLFAKGSENQYAAQMKWLYYSHDIDDRQRLRIGRIGTPIYYYSDYLNVGYAFPWVAPPRAVYFFDATITGVDYSFQTRIRDVDSTLELIAGTADQYQEAIDATAKQRNAVGVIGRFTWWDRLTFRAMMLHQTFSIEFESLTTDSVIDDGFQAAIDEGLLEASQAANLRLAIEPAMRPLIDEMLTIEDESLTYREIALRYEDQRWFLMLESIRADVDTYLLPETKAWYVTGGVRTGAFLWHATWSELSQPLCDECRADYRVIQQPPSGNFGEYFARTIRNSVLTAGTGSYQNASVGVTVDTSANSVVKVELEHMRDYPSIPTETAGIGQNWLLRAALCLTF